MSSRLVALTGPQQGTVFPIFDDEVTIGRDASNSVCITDLSSSRRHCSILRTPEGFQLNDLSSKNGTFVNDIPVHQRLLRHGDRIGVGDSAFIFLVDSDVVPLPAENQPEIGVLPTVRLRSEDTLYLQPEKLLTSLPLTARIARSLDAVFKLSRSIQITLESDVLHKKILECIFEATPAAHAAIVVLEEDSAQAATELFCDRDLQKIDVPFNRSLIQFVMNEGVAILSNEVSSDSNLGLELGNVCKTRIASLVVVPLSWGNQFRGILYMDSHDPSMLFDEDHLQFASAVATLGSAASENLRYMERLKEHRDNLIQNLRFEYNMIGESSPMKEVFRLISKVAPSDSTVLICGETGTGKELTARAIHFNSPRCDRPFLAVNCANLSETLLESELFGHEKGAFTGAYAQKKGKLEIADGGTLFLDEIAEIAIPLQARLLRVLQEREFERIGGTRTLKADIRLIAATNKDLQSEVRRGTFRQDLYYRINVVQITMPPLRERREDIPLLASYFVSKYRKKCGRRIDGISTQAQRCLLAHDWPGNVRELENIIERAAVLGIEPWIEVNDLPEDLLERSDPYHLTNYQMRLKEAKKKLVQEALEEAKGDHQLTAQILGVHPNNLHRMLRTLKLK